MLFPPPLPSFSSSGFVFLYMIEEDLLIPVCLLSSEADGGEQAIWSCTLSPTSRMGKEEWWLLVDIQDIQLELSPLVKPLSFGCEHQGTFLWTL